jgi:hypothetical protein
MPSVIEIYDRTTGIMIEQIKSYAPRSWVISAEGRVTITMSVFNKKCQKHILQHGNLVYIKHGPNPGFKGSLPDWGGVLDTPRTWGNGKVTCTAYTAEHLFKKRTGLKDKNYHHSPGEVFRYLIRNSNAREDLRIREGDIDDSGDEVPDEVISILSPFDQITALATKVNAYWRLTPGFDSSGKFVFYANWYRKLINNTGFCLTNSRVKTDGNFYVEQGDIINSALHYGNSVNWDDRVSATAKNQQSIDDYGLCEGSTSENDVSTTNGCQKRAQVDVTKNGDPRKNLSLYVTPRNENDPVLNYLDLCNVVTGEFPNVGFRQDGTLGLSINAWIRNMEFQDKKDDQTVKLTIEETSQL